MSILEIIKNRFQNSTQMSIFNYFKTNNPIIDVLLSTFFLTFISYIINLMSEGNFALQEFDFEKIKEYVYKKNSIIIEGKTSSTTCVYNSSMITSSAYSDRFKALWFYIINNIKENETIFQLKECVSSCDYLTGSSNKKLRHFLTVSQKKYFKINEDIYVRCKYMSDDINNEKMNSKTEKIIIEIYSYSIPLYKINEFIDNITRQFLSTIKTNRKDKQFIYILDKLKNGEDDSIYDCWHESEFSSSRTFNNLFFDEKQKFIDKIDFFINNRKWYENKGIPYTLGIGLHGPPGTGKTSLIKALANHTQRHLIFLSLKVIKTKQQLEKFFFENTYNSNNEKNGVTFDSKIIVIEDIDCIGDIVLKREYKKENMNNNNNNNTLCTIDSKKDDHSTIADVIKSVVDMQSSENSKIILPQPNNEALITLDDILNLWDGIRETPGRILIISSNHYDRLDSALVRPGRIDITHQLNNASHKTISEMYEHYFGKKINTEELQKVNEFFYSPAEIVSIYICNQTEESFMKRLLENVKVV